nr:serine protease 48-like [Drosophila takahashii]
MRKIKDIANILRSLDGFVLTALHCLSNDSMSVRLGESTRNPVGNFEFPVDGKWVPKKRDINLDDIGLLRMKIDVLLSDYIRPICLLYNEETPFKFQFKVTGWGMLENGEMGRILQNATVNRMYCTWIWFAGRDTSRICAGSQTSDSCAGYSGGPLSAEIDYHGEFRPMLYGIVSSGSKSCRGRGVYTYVSYYMNWITDLKNRHSNGTSSFVVTAAHCISNVNMTVRLGEYDTRHPRKIYEFEVDRRMFPQEYLESNNEQYDIGLLRMAMEVLFSDYIRPICLLYSVEMPIVSRFKVTGWGRLANSEFSPILQTATVSEIDRRRCANKHKYIVDQSQICAGSNSSDSCDGDSGGPLSAEVNYNGEVRPVLYGIVSYGSPNCKGLGVYTNVTHYMNWIIGVMTRNSNDIELNLTGSALCCNRTG